MKARAPRTRGRRRPAQAPTRTVTLNFRRADGSIWERVQIDRRTWNAFTRLATEEGSTPEERLLLLMEQKLADDLAGILARGVGPAVHACAASTWPGLPQPSGTSARFLV